MERVVAGRPLWGEGPPVAWGRDVRWLGRACADSAGRECRTRRRRSCKGVSGRSRGWRKMFAIDCEGLRVGFRRPSCWLSKAFVFREVDEGEQGGSRLRTIDDANGPLAHGACDVSCACCVRCRRGCGAATVWCGEEGDAREKGPTVRCGALGRAARQKQSCQTSVAVPSTAQ